MPEQPAKLDYESRPKARPKPFSNILVAGVIGFVAIIGTEKLLISVFQLDPLWMFAGIALSVPIMLTVLYLLDRPYGRS